MMARNVAWVAMVLVILAGMAGQCQAGLSLGSAQDDRHAVLEQGRETSFRIFLFNVHQEEDVQVYLGVYGGDGLRVGIDPESTYVPYSRPGEHYGSEPGFVYVGTGQGDVRARVVTVSVSAPLEAETRTHEVVIYAGTERQDSAFASTQIRKFFFSVDVGSGSGTGMEEGMETESDESGNESADAGDNSTKTGEGDGKETDGTAVTGGEGGSITGAVTVIPAVGPFVLAGVVVLFVVLRLLKRI